MRVQLTGLYFSLLLVAALAGCSVPGMTGDATDCPELKVAFAGPAHPVVCAGAAVNVSVLMADEEANVSFVISSSSGTLTPVPEKNGTWLFEDDGTPSVTTFRTYIESDCGNSVSKFDVTSIACDGTDSDSSATDSADDTDTDTAGGSRPDPPQIAYDGPRHVILFIGDGMGQPCETGLSRYLYGTDAGLTFHDFAYVNYVTTWDISTYDAHAKVEQVASYEPDNFDPVLGYDPELGGASVLRGNEMSRDYISMLGFIATDSGAAGTALATGNKTERQNIAWRAGDAEDGAIETIAEQARSLGMKMGVVSTVGFSHATPASFVSHNVNRNNLLEIAREIIFRTVPDVLIGAGHPEFAGGYSSLSEAEYSWLTKTDTLVFSERAEGVDGGDTLLIAAKEAADLDKPLFGLFGASILEEAQPLHTPGAPTFAYATAEDPSLSEAVQAALSVLSSQNDEKGFFLMVEGGAIDKANHATDYNRMIGNMWDFDRAVNAAMMWINKPGDDITMENTLVIVTADHANGYITYDENNPMGVGELPLADENPPRVTYGIGDHTNELVHIYATGAGIAGGTQRLFAPYEYESYPQYPIIDNTHIYKAMAHFLGVTQSDQR